MDNNKETHDNGKAAARLALMESIGRRQMFADAEHGDVVFITYAAGGCAMGRVTRTGTGWDGSHRVYARFYKVSCREWSNERRVIESRLLSPLMPQARAKRAQIHSISPRAAR